MINRAIGNKLVNSSVGEEGLYNALLEAAKVNSPVFANTMEFEMQTSPSLNDEANEAIAMLKAARVAPQMSQQRPAFCSPTFQGPLTPEQQLAVDNGACEAGSNWTPENTTTALGTLAAIFSGITGLFGNGGNDGPPAVGDNSDTDKAPAAGTDVDYMPWVFGGSALLIIIIVGVLLYLKAKKG